MKLLIRNATVYDPKNGIHGEMRSLYIRNGRISRAFKNPDSEIDASGLLALPGGIEAGTAFTTYGLSLYGFQQGWTFDPASVSGAYAHLGYTHLHESLMFPTMALATHHFLSSLPYQDGSASLCLSLRELGGLIGSGSPPEWVARFLDTCAQRFRALNIRLPEISAHFRESNLSRFNIQASRVLDYLAGLPLKIPLLLETASRLLDETLPEHPNLFYSHIGRAIDGEYAFKQAVSHMASGKMKGDMGLMPPVSHHQIQTEPGMGHEEGLTAYPGTMTPLRYIEVQPSSTQTSLTLSLATHPEYKRHLAFSSLCVGAQAGEMYPVLFKQLFENDPSYTVSDFVWQTRVLPAALLGLKDKGHLGIGAVGDMALYQPEQGTPLGETLSRCHTLIKSGQPVMEAGQFTGVSPRTQTFFRSHEPSERDLALFMGYFKAYPRIEHLDVPESLSDWQPIPIT